jgi:hypothetical protein
MQPTFKQIEYLKGLALSRRETFVIPQTREEASAAIQRAKYRPLDRSRYKRRKP